MAKPSKVNCPCGHEYVAGKQTSVFRFVKSPEYNTIQSQCSVCKRKTFYFDISDGFIDYLLTNNTPDGDSIRYCENLVVSPEILALYLNEHDIPIIREKDWLSPRQLARVAFLGWLLDHNALELIGGES